MKKIRCDYIRWDEMRLERLEVERDRHSIMQVENQINYRIMFEKVWYKCNWIHWNVSMLHCTLLYCTIRTVRYLCGASYLRSLPSKDSCHKKNWKVRAWAYVFHEKHFLRIQCEILCAFELTLCCHVVCVLLSHSTSQTA